MTFAQFCETAENTELEQQLLKYLNENEEMQKAKEVLERMQTAPVVGKLCVAINALSDCASLAEFKQTEHYQNVKDWNFSFDPDKGHLSFQPSSDMMKKGLKIVSAIGAGLAALILCLRYCRSRKRK